MRGLLRDPLDLAVLLGFELGGLWIGTSLLSLGNDPGAPLLFRLAGLAVVSGQLSVLLGMTWYLGMVQLACACAFPFALAGVLAAPMSGPTFRTIALVAFVSVLAARWSAGRIFVVLHEDELATASTRVASYA